MTHYLANYAYFTNKFDLDEAVSKHRAENWQAMNKTDGAAHLKQETVASAIRKSNVTVRRAVRKLVALGIVEKTHFVRPVMNGLSANIYAVLPFREVDSTIVEPLE